MQTPGKGLQSRTLSFDKSLQQFLSTAASLFTEWCGHGFNSFVAVALHFSFSRS
jgi:hypothetical protein